MRIGAHGQLAVTGMALHGRMQEGARRTPPAAAMEVELHAAHAVGPGAIDVGFVRHAAVDRRRMEGIGQRVPPVGIGDGHRATAAAVALVARADALFHALEIGQHAGVIPPAIAQRRPTVEVRRVAAIDDHAVDGARPTDHAAVARRRHAPATGGAGNFVAPGDRRVAVHLRHAGGHRDPEAVVHWPGLEQAHALTRIGQARGDYAARRAAADYHVIESVHLVLPYVSSQLR